MQTGLSLSALGLWLVAASPAAAIPLQPHEAVYDLSLVSQSSDFSDVNGRIALQLKADGCSALTLDYRFVARFQSSGHGIHVDILEINYKSDLLKLSIWPGNLESLVML